MKTSIQQHMFLSALVVMALLPATTQAQISLENEDVSRNLYSLQNQPSQIDPSKDVMANYTYRAETIAQANSQSGESSSDATSQDASNGDLAMKLQNPIADLISVPIQSNWDFGIGQADAMQYTANVQPVIPFSITEDWNVITRTIFPMIYAESPTHNGSDHFGLGDTLQSFFFSPKEPVGGWVVGFGPALLWPTATDNSFAGGQWGAGPTAIVLKQQNGWTYGMLTNHVWSYAGWGDNDRSTTFIQPFLSYTTKTQTSFTVNTETSYDWEHEQWTVPINAMVSQLVTIGKQPFQFQFGGRYYAEAPTGGPEWGLRFAVTLLFPK
jgi:hypothetical protein